MKQGQRGSERVHTSALEDVGKCTDLSVHV